MGSGGEGFFFFWYGGRGGGGCGAGVRAIGGCAGRGTPAGVAAAVSAVGSGLGCECVAVTAAGVMGGGRGGRLLFHWPRVPRWRVVGVLTVWTRVAPPVPSFLACPGRRHGCPPSTVFLLPVPPHLLLPPFRRAAQKLSVGAGMCASLAATSAFLEAVNLTMGPTTPVSYEEKRTFCGCSMGAGVGSTGRGLCAHRAQRMATSARC